MTEKSIIDAYCRIRTIDQTIPDDVLDFMKDSALEKLRKINKNKGNFKNALIENFNSKALKFINESFTIEGKTVPTLSTDEEIQKVYNETYRVIFRELMFHRNNPISDDRLNQLKHLSNTGALPQHLTKILVSL